jgi:hypothetical protein
MSVVIALTLVAVAYPCGAMELASGRNEIARGLVRRDTTMHMEPGGELVQDAAKKEKGFDKCRDAFEYGSLDSNTCLHAGSELIDDMTLCSEAAKEMNFGLEPDKEKIPWNYFDQYPEGCFHAPCNESTSGCLFYNPDGDIPHNPTGLPVCSKPRYAYGQEGSESCPSRYEAMSRDACQGAAMCLGDEEDNDFEIQPEDQHLYVPGCSLHNTTGFLRVHWNPPLGFYTQPAANATLLETDPQDVEQIEANHDKLDETVSHVEAATAAASQDGATGSGSTGTGGTVQSQAGTKEGVVICRAPNMTLSNERNMR